MCNKAVDFYLLALNFLPDWYVTNKIIKKRDNTVFSNDDMIFGDIDSNIFTFFSNDIGFNSINLNNDNLDDDNFDDCDPETINHDRLMAWHKRNKQYKARKKKGMKNYCL